jgi:hypothetical protein
MNIPLADIDGWHLKPTVLKDFKYFNLNVLVWIAMQALSGKKSRRNGVVESISSL